MSHIAVWKYYDTDTRYYFNEDQAGTYLPTYKDRIKINSIPEFPTFDLKVENSGGLLEYSAGSFRVRFSFLQPETSVNGDSIKDFLFPSNKPCKFLIQVYFSDTCHFSGFFTSIDLEKALTYTKNDNYVDIRVVGSLKEFADSYSQPNQGTRVLGGTSILPFEGYISFHFDNHYYWTLDLPATTYRERINSTTAGFNAELQRLVDVNGGNFNGVPRWETFQQLRKGLGFDVKLEFTVPSMFITQRPQFTLKIFWLPDLANQEPIALQTLSHDVSYQYNTEWVFIPSRFANVDYGGGVTKQLHQGIIFNKDTLYNLSYSDSDFNPRNRMTAFAFPKVVPAVVEDGITYVVPQNAYIIQDTFHLISSRQFTAFPEDTVNLAEQKYYEYNRSIYDNTYNSGGMTYGYMFSDNPVNAHRFLIQAYLVNTYQRYLFGLKEVKTMEVVFNGNEGIDLFKTVILENKTFWISEINSINLQTRTATIKAIEL